MSVNASTTVTHDFHSFLSECLPVEIGKSEQLSTVIQCRFGQAFHTNLDRGYTMDYWYISLSKNYPPKVTREAKLSHDFVIIECIRPVNKKVSRKLDLIYIGYGFFKDSHIQDNFKSYIP